MLFALQQSHARCGVLQQSSSYHLSVCTQQAENADPSTEATTVRTGLL